MKDFCVGGVLCICMRVCDIYASGRVGRCEVASRGHLGVRGCHPRIILTVFPGVCEAVEDVYKTSEKDGSGYHAGARDPRRLVFWVETGYSSAVVT